MLWQLARVPAEVWGIILASGIVEAMYFTSGVRAYRTGDLSLAYPLARNGVALPA